MTSSAPSRRDLRFAASEVDLRRFARVGIVIAVVASGLLIYHLNRGSSFSPDDWIWITTRRGNSLHTFLAPYNGHLSLVPLAIYRLMFAVVGIGSFVPYRLMLLVVASVTGVVIFDYGRRRIGEFGGLILATLLLFLGPGWNDIMQPFQIAWLIAFASAILALSLLDRRRTWADVAACLLILVSIASTSVGVALAVGIAVDLALTRRRWRDMWIAGLPLLLYLIWALAYHPSPIQVSAVSDVPLNVVQTTAAALSGLVGLSQVTPTDLTGDALAFGVPLLVLAVGVVVVRARAGWDWTRFAALGAALVTFTLMVTVVRSFQSPFESRYMYATCVLVALMAVEVVRGLVVPFQAQLAIAALTLVAVVSNTGDLRSAGGAYRQTEAQTDAALAAVGLDRGRVASDTMLTQLPGYPFTPVTAAQYFDAEHALGTPAYSLTELSRASPPAQHAADAQLLTDRDVTLARVSSPPSPSGVAPGIDGAVGGAAVGQGACVAFTPAAALAPGQTSTLALRLNPGRVAVSAGAGPAGISVRRFGPAFTTLGSVQTGGSAIVSVSHDLAPQPWHLQVQSASPVRVCALGDT